MFVVTMKDGEIHAVPGESNGIDDGQLYIKNDAGEIVFLAARDTWIKCLHRNEKTS